MTTPSYDVLSTGLDALAARHPGRPGAVSVGRLYNAPDLRLRTIAIDGGAVLDEHIAGVPVLIHVVAGRVRLEIGGVAHELTSGAIVRADPLAPHTVFALEPSRLVLTLVGRPD